MGEFKQFLSKRDGLLNYPSSFSELRKSDPTSVLSWSSSHIENRDKQDDEAEKIDEAAPADRSDYSPSEHAVNYPESPTPNPKTGYKHHAIHDSPDLLPEKLTRDMQTAVRRYATLKSDSKNPDGAGNMNSWLRQKAGDKNAKSRYRGDDHDEAHINAIKKLSSAFTPNNTNKKNLVSFGGVPDHIGQKFLAAKKNSKHVLAGFTSTSTKFNTAKNFATSYADKDMTEDSHIVKYHLEPSTGLSLVHHSTWNENEVVLNHGTHITYKKSDVYGNVDGTKTYVHHVIVHPKRTPLEKYQSEYG